MASAPNVVLLLTDQQRYDVTAPDGPAVETPAIDRLADDGMWFSRAYTPISICSSARASMLSGLYPHTHGMLNNCHEADAILSNFPTGIPTFGELLGEAGYEGSYVGKWHLGRQQTPEDFGFEYLGGGDALHDLADPGYEDYLDDMGIDPEEDEVVTDDFATSHDEAPTTIAGTTSLPPEATRTYYIAERTIDRIEAAAATEGPILHRTDFAGPHHPYVVPEPYASMYDPDDLERWDSFDETFADKPAVHEQYLEYRGVADLDWEHWARAAAKYFGFVSFIDDQIGRIVAAIDEHLDAENTLVVHTSDHGDFTGSHRQFNKGPLMYEGTYHIPLVARWPAVVEPGVTCDAFVRLLDLMATFLDAGGVEPPQDVEARSLVPLLEGRVPEGWPETVFAEFHGDEFGLYSQRMVRSDRYKLVYNVPDTNELYDLRKDPAELHNLIDHPEYQETRREHERRLGEWMRETGDPLWPWTRKLLAD